MPVTEIKSAPQVSDINIDNHKPQEEFFIGIYTKIFLTNSLRMEKYQHLIDRSFLLDYLCFNLKHSLMEWKNFLLMISF